MTMATVICGHKWVARLSPTRAVVRLYQGQELIVVLRGLRSREAARQIEATDTAIGLDMLIERIASFYKVSP